MPQMNCYSTPTTRPPDAVQDTAFIMPIQQMDTEPQQQHKIPALTGLLGMALHQGSLY
jgi:hypothetical protein